MQVSGSDIDIDPVLFHQCIGEQGFSEVINVL